MSVRAIVGTTAGMPASDGAGVRLTRLIGSPELDMLDPFLMLDSFQSDDPGDYIAGFPPIPIAASRPSPICWPASCAMRTTPAMPASSRPAASSG